MKTDFSSSLAADMDKALTENKDVFSQAAMLEKLAFTRVADEDKVVSEIEIELSEKADAEKVDLTKSASVIERPASLMDSFNTLLKVSEDLDNAGFDKLAAASLMLANHVVCAAKGKSVEKSKSKSKTEKSKEKSKSEKSKSKSKKPVSKSERMKKLREMSKGKKKVSKAQDQRPTEVQFGTPGAQTPKAPNPAAPAPQAPAPDKATGKPADPKGLEATLKQKFQATHPDTFAALQWQQFTVSPSATAPGTYDVVAKVAVAPKGAQHMAQVAKSAPGGSVSNMLKSVLEGFLPQGSKVSVMTVPYNTGGAGK